MEHESFENPRSPSVLNAHFVSIKVDREERPDVDRVYMTFVQATTGSGGWPMSVWLTPSLRAVLRRHLLSPDSAVGQPGFVEILEEIARVWREERDKVEQSARRSSSSASERALATGGGPAARRRRTCSSAHGRGVRAGLRSRARRLRRRAEVSAAERAAVPAARARADRAAEPRDMALVTLRAMALGGMRDHIGGGFHRYSVDADWRVPHFEKMLYDQAQLVLAYVEAAQVTGDRFYAEVAIDTLDYVRRDLTDARRRLLLGRGRRQHAARARRRPPGAAQDGGRVLHLAR